MELNLYFSEEEMTDFLKRKGYTVKDIKTWYNQSEYHNSFSIHKCKVKIAYRKKPLKELLERDKYSIESRIGLETIFRKEMLKKMLEL